MTLGWWVRGRHHISRKKSGKFSDLLEPSRQQDLGSHGDGEAKDEEGCSEVVRHDIINEALVSKYKLLD